jgi:hypothetical protein
VTSVELRSKIILFNEVVEDLEVEDVNLVGRKFTWFHPNGLSMSRIYRALVSEKWGKYWGICFLWALPRYVSDHCPLVLKTDTTDWGPKPFWFNNHWLENWKFKKVVERAWGNHDGSGWMRCVLKSKLKGLKGDIREWNKVEYGNVEMRLVSLRDDIEELDAKSEMGMLTMQEVEDRRLKFAELWRLWKSKESMLLQMSKSKWLKEGDANSKYFHRCIKSRALRNGIKTLNVGNKWVYEVGD